MLTLIAFFTGILIGLIGSYFIFKNNKDKAKKYNDYLDKF